MPKHLATGHHFNARAREHARDVDEVCVLQVLVVVRVVVPVLVQRGVDGVGHVLAQGTHVELLELVAVVEVLAHRVGLGVVLVQDVEV